MSDLLIGDIGIDIIKFLQTFSPLLDSFFIIITNFGNAYLYIFIISLIYWLYSKETGINLAFIVLISVHINSLIKGFMGVERPFVAHPTEVKAVVEENGYSFVSGHAQYAAAFWASLLYYFKTTKIFRYLLPVSIILMILIPVSRLYLGVHYPSDIVVGFLVGLGTIYAYLKLAPKFIEVTQKANLGLVITLSFVISVIMLFLEIGVVLVANNDLTVMESLAFTPGAFLGAFVGMHIEQRSLQFNPKPERKISYVLRPIIGLIIIVISYLIPNLMFKSFPGIEMEIIRHYLQFFLIGLSIAYITPFLFTKVESRLFTGSA